MCFLCCLVNNVLSIPGQSTLELHAGIIIPEATACPPAKHPRVMYSLLSSLTSTNFRLHSLTTDLHQTRL